MATRLLKALAVTALMLTCELFVPVIGNLLSWSIGLVAFWRLCAIPTAPVRRVPELRGN